MNRRSVSVLPGVVSAVSAGLTFLAAASAAQPTVEYALGLKPFQQGIDYDQLSAEEAKKSTIKMEKEGGVTAWVVRGPREEVLRSFADTNGDRVVDRWSYYKDGIEVYRDVDANHNAKADQARWLNAAGSRWGIDADENGSIDSWRSLSPEECTAEIVEAMRNQDAARFKRLLPTAADLEEAGFEGQRLKDLAARSAAAASAFAALARSQKQVGPQTQWNNMLANRPGVVPAGTSGLTKDVMVYENVVALIDTKGSGDQVYVGTLVRFGDVWRPVDLPREPGAAGEVAEPLSFFSPSSGGLQAAPGGQENQRLKPLLTKLRDIEAKLGAASGGSRNALAAEQADLLGQVVAAADPGDKTFWVRQYAETLAAGVQDGSLTEGLGMLEKLAGAVVEDEPLAAFVMFRLASARYAAAMQQPGADIDAAQNAWLTELGQFVEKHPTAPDAAEAMLQMGIADEFSGREKEAIGRYESIAKEFPDSASARKARGAARRLEITGKPLALSGTGLDGKPVAVEKMRGTPVLVHYWATWCEPCKVDIAQIRELYAKYGPKKFQVVGVTLDSDKQQLAAYLAQKQIPWPQLHEPGGLDGRLAEELGVLTLPTMLLLDAQGNVVDRSLAITDLERKLESMIGGK
ncbi:MAG: redoxin domain-containing protein [Planctomycetia bacterium]